MKASKLELSSKDELNYYYYYYYYYYDHYHCY